MVMADERIVCPACGKEARTGEEVCTQCGFPLERFRGPLLSAPEVQEEFERLVKKHRAEW